MLVWEDEWLENKVNLGNLRSEDYIIGWHGFSPTVALELELSHRHSSTACKWIHKLFCFKLYQRSFSFAHPFRILFHSHNVWAHQNATRSSHFSKFHFWCCAIGGKRSWSGSRQAHLWSKFKCEQAQRSSPLSLRGAEGKARERKTAVSD